MNAPWLPFILTSCPGKGYRVHSASKDLTSDELDELGKLTAYTAPRSSLPEPTDADLANFPVRHGFFRLLSSGRYVIAKSQYAGQDYSGRYGNYLAQAFVLKEGELPDYPARYLNSRTFQDLLPFRTALAAETDSSWPLTVPNVSHDSFHPRPLMPDEQFAQYMQRSRCRLALANLRSGRCLLVDCASTDEWLLYFECWQRSFPLNLAHRLTGASYSDEPARFPELMVQSIVEPLSRSALQDLERLQSFHILDGSNGSAEGRYAMFINDSVGFSWDNPIAFFQFLGLFSYQEINDELGSGFLLWQLLQTPSVACTPEEFSDALSFGVRYGSSEFFRRSMDALFSGQWLDRFFAEPDTTKSLSLLEFVASDKVRTADPEMRAAKSFFWNMLAASLNSANPLTAVALVRRALDADIKLAAAVLDDSTVIENTPSLLKAFGSSETANALLDAIAEMLRRTGWEGCRLKGARRLARACAAIKGTALLAPANAMDDSMFVFGALAMSLAREEKHSFEAMEAYIGTALENRDPKSRDRVLNLIDQAGLEKEALTLSARLQENVTTEELIGYLGRVFKSDHYTAEEKRDMLHFQAGFLMQDLPALCQLVARFGKTIANLNAADAVLSLAEGSLGSPPWPPNDRKAICALKQYARTSGNTPPLLALAGFLADDNVFPPPLEEGLNLEKHLIQLEQLEQTDYMPYAKLWLRSLWSRVVKRSQLKVLCANVCLRRHPDFAIVFAELLKTGLIKSLPPEEGMLWAAYFAQTVFPREENKKNMRPTVRTSWDTLIPAFIYAFVSLGKKKYYIGAENLKKQEFFKSGPWIRITTEAAAAIHEATLSRGMFGALKNFFRRKSNH